MPLLVVGQKRKGLTAFKTAVKTISDALNRADSGDHNAALAGYNEALELLRSDLCRQALSSDLIADRDWTDHVVEASFGRVKSVVALDRRNVVFDQAEKLMFDVFALRPDLAAAHEFMADLAVSRGCPQNAARYLNKLLSGDPKHSRGRFLLAVLDFENGLYEEAIKKFNSLEESGETLSYTARCYLRISRFNEAVEMFERARWQYGDSFDVVYYLACALAHSGRIEEAERAFEEAARLDLSRTETAIQRGFMKLLAGDVADAEKSFREAINRGARDAAAAYYGLTMTARQGGNGEQYRAAIDNLRRIAPTSDYLRCALGVQHELAGETPEAGLQFAAVAPSSHLAGAAYSRLGFMRYRTGNFQGAFDALQTAAGHRPSDSDVLGLLGATAALVGQCSVAVKAWSQTRARDARTTRALKQAAMRVIIEDISEGRIRKAIDQLEAYKNSAGEDESIEAALADLYFIEAVDLLKSGPSNLAEARELLLVGKHQTGHPKFEYCLGIADLVEGHYQQAAARLRAVLAANAKNPGASYHLGLALLRSGDVGGAETALRHGTAVSMNNPARLGRLKWALAALMATQQRWSEAVKCLEGFVSGEENESQLDSAEVLDLQLRCLVMSGEWETAERMALAASGRKQSALAAIMLARRNMKARRPQAAFLHVERFLKLAKNEGSIKPGIIEKARSALVQLLMKVASAQVKEQNVQEAEVTLKRAIPVLSYMSAPAAPSAAVREFLEALELYHHNSAPAVQLADFYEGLAIDVVLDKEDFAPPEIDFPVVLPPKPQPAFDLLKEFLFDPSEWNADPHPRLLIAFDS